MIKYLIFNKTVDCLLIVFVRFCVGPCADGCLSPSIRAGPTRPGLMPASRKVTSVSPVADGLWPWSRLPGFGSRVGLASTHHRSSPTQPGVVQWHEWDVILLSGGDDNSDCCPIQNPTCSTSETHRHLVSPWWCRHNPTQPGQRPLAWVVNTYKLIMCFMLRVFESKSMH